MSRMLSLMAAFLLFVSIPQVPSVVKFGLMRADSTSLKSTTIVVPDDHTIIQEAIDAADPGDTIYVRNGTYYENIFVNKTISLVGENPETTIIDGSKSNVTFSPVVHLFGEDARNVGVCNFTIRGSSNAWGIYITFHANARIEENIIANNSGGVVADFSDNNTFVNNTVINNKFEGLVFFRSSGNIMKNNTIIGNTYNFGISALSFVHDTDATNLVSPFAHDIDTSNLIDGKPIYYLKNRSNLSINPLTFPNLGYLALVNCESVTVEGLHLENNYNGLLLVNAENSTLRNNRLMNNVGGIGIVDSSNNDILGNHVTDSYGRGISLIHSPNNRFRENNLIGNRLDFKVSGGCLSDFMQDIDVSNTVNGKVMRYLINYTNSVVNPSTFSDTGYLALVNCYNVTAENLCLEDNEILVAFTQNSSIIKNMITSGGITLAYSSSINLTDNMVINGRSGISIYHGDNSTVAKNNIAQNTEHGIYLQASSCNTVFGNDVKSNDKGMWLSGSSNNTIFGNNITDNKDYGIILSNSSYNKIFHNNFINNAIPGWQAVSSDFVGNNWDNGYPSGGNYWSDYNGTDLYSGTHPQNEPGSDGIGVTPYTNIFLTDHYPLTKPIRTFATGVWEGKTCNVNMITNSTISNFKLNDTARTVSFNVTGEEGKAGFCRITIPNVVVQELWNKSYSVLVDGEPWPFRNWTDIEDAHIYVDYTHSGHEITIVPEFPKAPILTIFMMIATFVIIAKKKLTKSHRNMVCNHLA